MTGLVSRGDGRIGLHHEIARRPGHAVLIRTVVHHRRDSAEIIVRRGRCRSPFERRRSEEHTPELQSRLPLLCRLLLEKKTIDDYVPLRRVAAANDLTAD